LGIAATRKASSIPTASPKTSPSASEFTFLAKLNLDVIEKDQVAAITNYADLWVKDIAPNQPIRMNGETLAVELGQGTFGAAMAAWKAIS